MTGGLICPRCHEIRSMTGMCSCDVDGIAPNVTDGVPPVPPARARRTTVHVVPAPTAPAREVPGCWCGKPTRDGAFVCDGCLNELAADLARVPAVFVALTADLDPSSGIDYASLGGGSGGSASQPLPIRLATVVSHDRLRSTLRGLVVSCLQLQVEHTAPSAVVPPKSDVPGMARWLLWRVPGMAWHSTFASAPSYVRHAMEWADYVTTPRPPQQMLGECPVPGCGGRMFASEADAYAACDRCAGALGAQALRDASLDKLDARLCTAAEIARLSTYMDIRSPRETVAALVRQWAHRGRLTASAIEKDGSPRYRFGTVKQMLREHEARHIHNWSPWVPTEDGQRQERRCLSCDEVQGKRAAKRNDEAV